ncbi:polyprenyl diphosphate synthase, partial [Alphaproteobacteria bacterium]|nr:polyprenyl diphosphate synthase [Alphaproteobacteria bacterium]
MEYNIEHIAFIMDGNQRWSKKNNKKIEEGYLAGFNNLEKIINYCLKINIKYITVFALSSENLKRNSSYLIFKIIRKIYKKLLKDLNNEKININIVGEKKNLPEDILKIFKKIKYFDHENLQLNIAFNYGTQYEVKNIIESFIKNNSRKVNLKTIRQQMYLGNIPDPEILIRTGGF